MPFLKQLVGILSQWRTWFEAMTVCVGFVVDKLVLGQVFLTALVILPLLFYRCSTVIFHSFAINTA
jgi:hypothetical protein